MPTYEYKCEDCGYVFERFQGIKDKAYGKCPKCAGKVRRLISGGGGVIFKGSGLHATDYARSNSPACGRDEPCCGRDIACDNKPCES
jgi:putative FmdB family regulatory protein